MEPFFFRLALLSSPVPLGPSSPFIARWNSNFFVVGQKWKKERNIGAGGVDAAKRTFDGKIHPKFKIRLSLRSESWIDAVLFGNAFLLNWIAACWLRIIISFPLELLMEQGRKFRAKSNFNFVWFILNCHERLRRRPFHATNCKMAINSRGLASLADDHSIQHTCHPLPPSRQNFRLRHKSCN